MATQQRIGIWVIGIKGSISLTMILGCLAINRGLKSPVGMLTATDLFDGLPLPALSAITFGGCDIRPQPIRQLAAELQAELSLLGPEIFTGLTDYLNRLEADITPGTMINCGRAIEDLAPPRPAEPGVTATVDAIRQALRDFRQGHRLDEVIVVNLASTEPPLDFDPCHQSAAALQQKFAEGDRRVLRASTLYAYGAIMEDCPYINFTPSNAALPPALVELAAERGVPVMGSDGKTGETLVKSTLAPMFASRNLEVLSWEGFNLLGNLDGKVLDSPDNCASKLKSKDQVLHKILGYAPHSRVHINYVPSLADQKTAWDFIHFQGFLGAKMSLQFTWQGYDSLLAAPLVLDLARLAALAKARGEGGLMPQLASFFKAPLGVSDYRHAAQVEMLRTYIADLRASLQAAEHPSPLPKPKRLDPPADAASKVGRRPTPRPHDEPCPGP